MSKIPRVAKIPRHSAKVSHDLAASEEHEELLRLVWKNIGCLVEAKFAEFSKRVFGAANTAIESHARETTELIQALERHVKGDRLKQNIKALLKQSIPLCEAYAKQVPGDLNEDRFVVTVESTTLERPIVETKGRRGEERDEQVGFIDIECQIRTPVRAKVISGIPYEIASFSSAYGSLFDERLTNIGKFGHPEWGIDNEVRILWIDIRPELPAVGQLLRELKTLRAHTGERSLIWIITEAADKQIEEMLQQEGFLLSCHDWIDRTLSALE